MSMTPDPSDWRLVSSETRVDVSEALREPGNFLGQSWDAHERNEDVTWPERGDGRAALDRIRARIAARASGVPVETPAPSPSGSNERNPQP